MNVQKFLPKAVDSLTGKTIVSVGSTYLRLDNGMNVYLEDDEIEHINSMFEEDEKEEVILSHPDYQIVRLSDGKYLSFNMQGSPQFFEGWEMGYLFDLEKANKIVEKFNDLQLKIVKLIK